MSQRHRVFLSYHHVDERYKARFVRLFELFAEVLVDHSVKVGDIDQGLSSQRIRQIIREQYLTDTSVTIVIVGSDTWKRKHVDWEISSSIRETRMNLRSGLLGILLPTRRDYKADTYDTCTIPPRLHDNLVAKYAALYDWTESAASIQSWVHEAFVRRKGGLPNNSRTLFRKNRTASQWE